jgi:reactive intermediate/imine deaminase
MTKKFITTTEAPAAIGVYSQAVVSGNTLYISGQIPLIPDSMEIVSENIEAQIEQVFDNLTAICVEAGTKLDDAIKFNVYLTDLAHFPKVNTAMEQRLAAPYPARAVVEVSALPKGVQVEVDAIVDLS